VIARRPSRSEKLTAGPSSASVPKPSMNSDWIRSTRHGSVCTQSVAPRLSNNCWSAVDCVGVCSSHSTGPGQRQCSGFLHEGTLSLCCHGPFWPVSSRIGAGKLLSSSLFANYST